MAGEGELDVVPTKVIRVGVMGDSITAAFGGYGYVRELNKLCPGYKFFNHGIGANMTNQMQRRFKKDILDKGYNEVIILGGVNDIASGRKLETIQKALLEMYTAAKAKGMRVIAMTITPWGTFQDRPENRKRFPKDVQEKTIALNQWIWEQKSKGIVHEVIDLYPKMVDKDGRSLKKEFRGDGLHPSPAGQREMGRIIFETSYRIRVEQKKAATQSLPKLKTGN